MRRARAVRARNSGRGRGLSREVLKIGVGRRKRLIRLRRRSEAVPAAGTLRARFRRQIVDIRVFAVLQRADIGDDGPAVARLNLRRVVQHGAIAVCDHVVKVSHRRIPQAGRCDTKAAA